MAARRARATTFKKTVKPPTARFDFRVCCARRRDGRTPSEMRAPWLRHDARNQFIELFVEFSGCLHQRRIVAYDH